jgi:hypothetical protein
VERATLPSGCTRAGLRGRSGRRASLDADGLGRLHRCLCRLHRCLRHRRRREDGCESGLLWEDRRWLSRSLLRRRRGRVSEHFLIYIVLQLW